MACPTMKLPKLLVLSFLIAASQALHPARTAGGLHVPIHKTATKRDGIAKRDETGAIGLGSYFDVSYSVSLTLGDTQMPLVLDTGSSDLWVISAECTTQDCETDLPLYPKDTFVASGLPVQLFYGDSSTGTHAFGVIGQDTVSLAGISLKDHYIGYIDDTNTSVLDFGSAGIFGLGFPVNSFIWSEVFFDTFATSSRRRRRSEIAKPSWGRRALNLGRKVFPVLDFARPFFPDVSKLGTRQTSSASQWTPIITSSYDTMAPFLPRLVSLAQLEAPMFTVTLQRNSLDRGGNVGLLSIGELPETVKNDSLTWVPLRTYSATEGGIGSPPDSPGEDYPISWEIFINAVYFDGEQLPTSSLVDPLIAPSALIDTGNSLIRGPADLISAIYTRLGDNTFPCSTPHALTFEIGGQLFPVDPRDFVSQAFSDDTMTCMANLAVTDTPVMGQGYLHTWSLGDPFLKSVLSSFYYGNLSHPSQDSPRIGFLSTVPEDAEQQYRDAVSSSNGQLFATAEAAPTGLPRVGGTNSFGVQEAQTTSVVATSDNDSAGSGVRASMVGVAFSLVLTMRCVWK